MHQSNFAVASLVWKCLRFSPLRPRAAWLGLRSGCCSSAGWRKTRIFFPAGSQGKSCMHSCPRGNEACAWMSKCLWLDSCFNYASSRVRSMFSAPPPPSHYLKLAWTCAWPLPTSDQLCSCTYLRTFGKSPLKSSNLNIKI